MTGCLNQLARLGRDNAGNTLAIAAASLIPLMALIGGGVDVSRAYMAKTQLQSACDAGVLAGRKALSKSGNYGDSEKAKANSMFNFNFKGDALDVRNVSYTTDDNEDGQVLGTATATVPTLMMKIFNMDTVDLSVDCMAELQIGNADIMFVLDTTGSMGQPINWGEPAKIEGLRDAVRDFHRTINQAVTDNRTRIRYGFVPYSMTVNVRDLIVEGDLPASAVDSATEYQTRVADFQKAEYVAETPEVIDSGIQTYDGKISYTECTNYGENDFPSNGNNPVVQGTKPDPVLSTEYNYESWVKTGTRQEQRQVRVCNKWGCSWQWQNVNVDIGTCKRRWVKTRTEYETWYKFSRWVYQDEELDTSGFKNFGSVSVATDVTNARVSARGDYDVELLAQMQAGSAPNGLRAENVGTTGYTWNGCIEERSTVQETDFDPIPSDAFDLDFDTEAEDELTWWRPMWANVYFSRSSDAERSYWYNPSNGRYYGTADFSGNSLNLPGNPSSNCPAPMMLMRSVELSDDVTNVPDWLNTYVNNLNPVGNTYHDIGMIWGGRLTSPTGLFADNVNLDADKINVSKHIIFMTDGILEPTTSGYSAYGIERLDHRIAPAGEEWTITSRHDARFKALCEKIKAQGTTIWVVAFGTSMTSSLQQCASNGRAYYSSNTEALRNTFKFIAAQVADLRLGA